jgi:phosphoribosylaminoimidazole carboxylase
MLAAAASLLNIPIVILDVGEHAPAKQIVAARKPELAHIDGSFSDPDKIRELAGKVNVLTVEIEHVNVDMLEQVEKSSNIAVHPKPATIRIIQDKFLQKQHLISNGLPVAESRSIGSTVEDIATAANHLGLPLMLKARTLAYDGRGNFVLRDLQDAQRAIDFLGDRPLYAEKWVPFSCEIAVMVVRTVNGDVYSYPAVETVHKDNICFLVFAPLRSVDPTLNARACGVAEKAVKCLEGAGVFGVEMFLLKNGTTYIFFATRLS